LVLGNHVWICADSLILNGTNIGDGGLVGANSVCKTVCPNNCSVAGNPSKLIKKNIAWSRDMYAKDTRSCNGYALNTNDVPPPISGLNVLIVGGTKFMGPYLVNELIRLGNKVSILTRGQHKDNFGKSVNRIRADVNDYEQCKKALMGKKYDVVFNNIAYTPTQLRNVLDNIHYDKQILLSSMEVYDNYHPLMKEEEYNPEEGEIDWTVQPSDYKKGKQHVEKALVQIYKGNNTIVRLPFVIEENELTDRLGYYCNCIINEIPMNIDDITRGFTFVRTKDVGKMLPYLAGNEYSGIVNFSNEGHIRISEILSYIENKVNKNAIISSDGTESPFHKFNETDLSLDLDIIKDLGYPLSKMDWIFKSLDSRIDYFMKNKKSLLIS